MARKKKHPEHVNHERWLVSYADFITLLFAFFVVMFAVSQVDSKKMGRFTESFKAAVGIELFSGSGVSILGGDPQPMAPKEDVGGEEQLPIELAGLKKDLEGPQVQEELPQGLTVVEHRQELVIRLAENLIYDAGNDSLKEPAAKAIRALAKELEKRNVDVRVEGHTDNRPIHTPRFNSNWDLSTARATTVVGLLAKQGISPERLSAAGYGEFHPLAGNDTDEGRKQNRRVDIVVTVRQKERPAKPAPAPVHEEKHEEKHTEKEEK